MTYLFSNQMDAVPRLLDSFSRLRVSNPLTMFEHVNQYGTNTFKWDTSTSGTGTITDPTSNVSSMTVLATGGTTAGASAVRQTRAYMRFLAGKSLLCTMTFKLGLGVSGVAKRVGYFDVNNGVFLEQNGTAINFVVRSTTTGSVVDTAVPQTAWNIDKLDGTGPSGMTFDPTGFQNIRIDLIGANAYRLYFYYKNVYWLVHQLDNSNVGSPTVPSITTGILTLRQEITNIATAGATATLLVSNCGVISEGAQDAAPAYTFTTNNGITTATVTTRAPVLTIQAKTAGITGLRNFGWVLPSQYQLYADANAFYEVVLNATLTGASFSSVGTKSITNVDRSATALSGGTVIDSGYVTAANRSTAAVPLDLFFPLVYSSLANTQDTLTIAVTSLAATTHAAAAISWTEYY